MKVLILLFIIANATLSSSSDITNAVFGKELSGIPAAFGDFNSDAYTDVFVLDGKDKKTLKIMLASEKEPLLRPKPDFSCKFKNGITSIVPGDFDGDVFMDILITTFISGNETHAFILWGENEEKMKLQCPNENEPWIIMQQQPVAIDYNQDMIIDLFGTDKDGKRTFWISNGDANNKRGSPKVHEMKLPDNWKEFPKIKLPHSNAFLDLDDDYFPDLVVTTNESLEIWLGQSEGFNFSHLITLPIKQYEVIGQALFLDLELTGKLDLILPVCSDSKCTKSHILVYIDGTWNDLNVVINSWNFVLASSSILYTNTITLRGGDFNFDGYPDLLATLSSDGQIHSFLLQNVIAPENSKFNRTFELHPTALSPFTKNESVLAVFYDFYQDGVLDVIFVEYDRKLEKYSTAAFKNSLDYDANFVKVMVLTGRTNPDYPISPGSLGNKKHTYGTNLPGPSIQYRTITQDGDPRTARAAQLPQSAYFTLNLPFTTFGLGRTPNFIEAVTIKVANESREWPMIIPNSQMVVIPNPIHEPLRWKVQLFVTPSQIILLSAAALTATCGLITIIIGILYWKERREDKLEKLQEAHRFHFDAM